MDYKFKINEKVRTGRGIGIVIDEEEIKSIVTSEQFSRMEYRIGE